MGLVFYGCEAMRGVELWSAMGWGFAGWGFFAGEVGIGEGCGVWLVAVGMMAVLRCGR